MSSQANVLIGLVVGVAIVWWVSAPAFVSQGDARLRKRNPTHHKKLVRFYRTFGLLAIAVGVGISLFAR